MWLFMLNIVALEVHYTDVYCYLYFSSSSAVQSKRRDTKHYYNTITTYHIIREKFIYNITNYKRVLGDPANCTKHNPNIFALFSQ